MTKIAAFQGVRYNPQRFEKLDLAVSLPYDRIKGDLQEEYYQLDEHNIVRIIKGRALPGDTETDNQYTRAKGFYEEWLKEGILIRDPKPTIYGYSQEFRLPSGQFATRIALIAALQLTDYEEGIVLPHERTFSSPKIDRLNLLRATAVNFGLIFMVYPGDEIGALLAPHVAKEPHLDLCAVGEADVRHRLWVIDDQETIAALQAEMEPKRNLIIADGHHRYETALAYRDEMRQKSPAWEPDMAFNYRILGLVSMDDPGLTILPTHRLMHSIPNWNSAEFLAQAGEFFEVLPAEGKDELFSQMAQVAVKEHLFGLFDGQGYHLLRLKDEGVMDRFVEASRAREWKTLDVSILHELVIERVLGLSKESVKRKENIDYIRDAQEGIEAVNSGQAQFVFFLNPTKISQMRACSGVGEKMPQKSTDFYPKMISGLVMMPVGKGERLG
ncbi:MAG: DUF1015 domain-containing protein [Anaerolineae bacterium]